MRAHRRGLPHTSRPRRRTAVESCHPSVSRLRSRRRTLGAFGRSSVSRATATHYRRSSCRQTNPNLAQNSSAEGCRSLKTMTASTDAARVPRRQTLARRWASPPLPRSRNDAACAEELFGRAGAKPAEPQTKHVGEAATIVVARLLRIPLLGMDDGDARRIGRANGIPSVNSDVDGDLQAATGVW